MRQRAERGPQQRRPFRQRLEHAEKDGGVLKGMARFSLSAANRFLAIENFYRRMQNEV